MELNTSELNSETLLPRIWHMLMSLSALFGFQNNSMQSECQRRAFNTSQFSELVEQLNTSHNPILYQCMINHKQHPHIYNQKLVAWMQL